MATGRADHSMTLLQDGSVLVAGSGYPSLASAERFDSIALTWSTTASMGTPRGGHSATLLPNGKVLIAGGYNGTAGLATAELYDPLTGTWAPTGSMGGVRNLHRAMLLPDGRVLVVGGWDTGNTGPGNRLASCEIYEPLTGTWSPTGAMAQKRSTHTLSLLQTGKVLVVGGWDGATFTNQVELYDPATGAWTTTGAMPLSRRAHTSTSLLDGRVLVAGGYETNTTVFSSDVQIYDPATGQWTMSSPMPDKLAGHLAELLPTGNVLVMEIGGATLIFDPATSTWSAGATMTSGHGYFARSARLGGGRIMATGGGAPATLKIAEILDARCTADTECPTGYQCRDDVCINPVAVQDAGGAGPPGAARARSGCGCGTAATLPFSALSGAFALRRRRRVKKIQLRGLRLP